MRRAHQQGYVLFTVVVMLFIVAVTAYLVGYDASFNASQPTGELESLRAEYVAEAGMQNALWQNGNNACQGAFNIPATRIGADSYLAVAAGGGASSIVSLSVDQDTWIRNDDVTKNNGADRKNHVKFDSGKIEQALYRFDLSSLAPGSQINSATAWFYVTQNIDLADGPTTVHRVTSDWGEFDANWETMNGLFDSATVATIEPQSQGNVWVQVNLTAQVQAWVNGAANFGVLFNNTTEGSHPQFATKEDGAHAPRLDVTIGTSVITGLDVKALGTLASGVTRTVTRTNVRAYQSPSVVAPATGADVKDTFVTSASPGDNRGTRQVLRVGDKGAERYALIEFDLGSIPAGARILSAELSLNLESYTAAPQGASITARRMLKPWTEDGATYNHADGSASWDWPENHDISTAAVAVPFEVPATGRLTLDIRPLMTEWIGHHAPDFGLVLTGAGGVNNAAFSSSDATDATKHPGLIVTFACDCSTVCLSPRGSGDIAFIVDNAGSMSRYELELQANIEALGYTVTPLTSAADQAAYDAAADASDAFFVADTVAADKVSNKLNKMRIGVVSIQGELNDELGIAEGMGSTVGSSLEIVDTDNYITQPFTVGLLEVYRGGMQGVSVSGAQAPGLQTLGTFNGAAGLVAIERGRQTLLGTTPGRRVVLPLGGQSGNFRWDYLSHNGLLLVQRAIEWATSSQILPGTVPLLLVVTDSGNPSDQELLKLDQFQSWGYVVTMITASDSQVAYDAALADVDVVFINEDVPAAAVGNKLAATPVGVVTEQANQTLNLGFSDDHETVTLTSLTIDNDHFVTSPFTAGPVTLLTSGEPLAYLTGNIAPDIQVLATSASGGAVAALESGAQTINGTSPGRRLLLPWTGNNMDFEHLNDDGLLLLQRALEWAADDGGAKTTPYFLATEKTATLGGLDFTDRDIVEYELWTDMAELFFDGGPTSLDTDIDALHILANGNLLLSPTGDTTLGGLSIEDGDIVEYDVSADTAVMIFDGSALFTDVEEKVISVHVLQNGNLLLSTDSDATLGGLDFTDSDLVEYDRQNDAASLYFDSSLTTLNKEISAAHVLPNGHIVLSLKGDAALGGIDFGADDLVAYDPVADTSVMLFRGDQLFSQDNEKIIAVHVGPGTGKVSCSGTFRDEFDAQSFSGSNGTLEWSGAWVEVGESDGAAAGDTMVREVGGNYFLETSDSDNGGEGVERELDLGGAGSAVLTYEFNRDDVGDADDYTAVFVSANGAAGPWTEVARHAGPTGDPDFQPTTVDISVHISGNTRIRFLTGPDMDSTKEIWFDNIQVACTP